MKPTRPDSASSDCSAERVQERGGPALVSWPIPPREAASDDGGAHTSAPLGAGGVLPYYSHGGITIYHGDCRVILPQLGRFDLLLTDPPYGIGFAAQPTKWQRRAGQEAEVWDDDSAEEWLIGLARSKAQKQVIWGGNYYDLPRARCLLSWYKPDAPPSMGNVEYAWTNLDQNSRQISHSISATNAERVGHPTQKPLRVIAWALQQAGEAVSVIDPWVGSGTTLRAAKDLGITAVGIEREEKYCEMAATRLQQECLPLVSLGGGGGVSNAETRARSGCGEGQALPEGEREARRNAKLCGGAPEATELP